MEGEMEEPWKDINSWWCEIKDMIKWDLNDS